MTRLIKFRGKRVDVDEFVYGFLIIESNESHYIHTTTKGGVMIAYKVIPETVGQLLTSNINPNFFEGDIITDTMPISFDADLENAYAVTWENFHNISPTEFVIGNVHDNPELLKK